MTSFYRPASRAIPHRKRRRGPAIAAVAGLILGAGVLVVGIATFERHPRFKVKRVVFDGVPENRRAETESLTDGWIGAPLLFADIDRPLAALSAKTWVASAAARRIVPDTITVSVVARPPVALARRGDELWTIDRAGSWLGPYNGPLVSRSDRFAIVDPGELPEDKGIERGAAFLETLKTDDPVLFARVSEVMVSASGFTVVDADSRTRLLFGADATLPGRAAPIWRAFLALRPDLERHALSTSTADLRFADRIVLPQDAGAGGKT